MIKQVEKCFRQRDDIHEAHQGLFRESVEDMKKKRSIQHLRCWVHSFHVAEAFRNRAKQQDYQLCVQFSKMSLGEIELDNKRHRRPRNTGTATHSSRPPSKPPFLFTSVRQDKIRMSDWQCRESLERQYGRK